MSESSQSRAARAERRRRRGRNWSLVFLVILPAAALSFELMTRLCADTLFDPLWTPLHVVLVGLVPALYLWAWLGVNTGMALHRHAGLLAGIAFGVSAYYGLIFLPLAPLSAFAVLAWGLGLLGLSPILATIAGWRLLVSLARAGQPSRPMWLGALASAAVLLLAEVPGIANDVWLGWAASSDRDTRARGVELLRQWGDDEQLLRAAYIRGGPSRPGLARFLVGGQISAPDTGQAREIYFRVKGVAFNAVPRPPIRSLWRGFDADLGGAEVAGRSEFLHLESSRLDTSVDAAAAVGYTEWTLEFRNDHQARQAEARAEIALPSGGVVSRATLWVHGEEREAAFAGVSKARAAYERVVRRARDPLLVTQAMPERVLVQCFPVMPGSTMRIRIGVTFPLLPVGAAETSFTLPYLVARNFNLGKNFVHHAWLEGNAALQSSHAGLVGRGEGTLRGELPDESLSTVTVSSPWPGPGRHWAVDRSMVGSGDQAMLRGFVTQTIRTRQTGKRVPLVVVVDTSHMLGTSVEALAEGLERIGDRPATFVFPTERAPRVARLAVGGGSGTQVRALLDDFAFVGGVDNVPALREAFSLATEIGAPAVLWLHGPAPASLSPTAPLQQVVERDPQAPVLVPFAFAAGSNRVLHELGNWSGLSMPPRRGGAVESLAAYLDSTRPDAVTWSREWARVGGDETLPPEEKTSDHLVRLWAAEQVWQGCPGTSREACVALAVRYQLVTALSGAVVLENEQQYDEAGLKPVAAATVPTIPEPETWLLLGVLMAVLLALYRRERRRLMPGGSA